MIGLYTLASFWALGMGTGLIWFVSTLLDDGISALGLVCVLAVGVPFFGVLAYSPFGMIESSESPVLATLHKNEWVCSDSHQSTTFVMVGKVMTPMTTTTCIEYRRTR